MTARATSQPASVRRAQILNATLEMIGESGIEALTTAAIAKRVGIAEATIFKHFDSKIDILRTLIKTFTDRLIETSNNIQGSEADPYNKLILIFEAHLDMLKDNQGIPRLIFGESLSIRDQKCQDLVRNIIGHYTDLIQIIIKQGLEEGLFKTDLNPLLASKCFIGVLQHTVINHFMTELPTEKNDTDRGLIDFLLNLFKP
ncbi:TetR/AcrR family transcriptional regulator [Syntrophomonas erecta]